eukprot:TRINITY_DN1961_c0_g1_i1.p1 TRINITY_DN1961_c0_g1~~TRINITY_DN1961_c0_g1_i1.p1  ORF type:complete len:353 (+),score=42.07 TRINITY_DN1961_c0_g1_i1:69-1127(+)
MDILKFTQYIAIRVCLSIVSLYLVQKLFDLATSATENRKYLTSLDKMSVNKILNQYWAGELPTQAKDILQIIQYPEVYSKFGSQAPRGVLLHGLPGTGKTYFALLLAKMSESHFLYASASEFEEIFVGRGAQRVRNLFAEANNLLGNKTGFFARIWNSVRKKRSLSRVIIFIDELDSIGNRNGFMNYSGHSTVSQLLTCMDGLLSNHNIFVIAATNNLTQLDPALLRSGRFDRIIEMPLPSLKSRREIIEFYIDPKLFSWSEEDLDLFAKLTQGFNNADLKNLVNEAKLQASREHIADIERDHKSSEREPIITIVHFIRAFKALYVKIRTEKPPRSGLLDDSSIQKQLAKYV